MIDDLLKAIPIGFGLAFMIGPVFFMLLQTSIIKGVRAAIVFDVGVVLADVVFILFAYYGSQPFLIEIKDNPKLYFVGGAIFFIYGLGMLLKKETTQHNSFDIPEKKNYIGLLVKGFLLNFINVGVLAFWLVLVVGVSSSLEMNASRIFNFFTAIILTYFLTDIGKIVLAKQLRKKLTPEIILKIKHGMGLVLILFGIVLFIKAYVPSETINTLFE